MHDFFYDKKMGVMEHGTNDTFKFYKSWLDVDHILSYSETYTTFLNACMVTDPKKYIVTGAPRNDLLITSDGRSYLEQIFGKQIENSKLFGLLQLLGLFWQNQGNKSFQNPFGFKNFNPDVFDTFDQKDVRVVLKPHPQEEKLIVKYFKNYPMKNLLILKSKHLDIFKIDFYEVLNCGDILITDYSSIFYDFLLLNKPILFIPPDIKEYEVDRGFLMESYLNFVPGPTINNQNELISQISNIFKNNIDIYEKDRKWMLKFCHRYVDSNSSNRIFDFVENVILRSK